MSDLISAIVGLLVLVGIFFAVGRLMRQGQDDSRRPYDDNRTPDNWYSDPGGL